MYSLSAWAITSLKLAEAKKASDCLKPVTGLHLFIIGCHFKLRLAALASIKQRDQSGLAFACKALVD
ncbi:hypothetical protein EFP25_14900 [Lactiplantibacillus pentosus]|nr:hypothetical protein LP314_15690 [Lactiplantibacillus pentosus]MCT3300839.1 hypothetical protein [Lactiplantibacillus pentosus]MCT3313915.1 hypothetical protein [Lactiplantibacillus pentosus]MCT3328369.1 hypothetical protein [Lactiplantibacillus pentosus]PKX54954.1 hypothetical protein BIS22_12820 [Lactiplantibacillus pentosus]